MTALPLDPRERANTILGLFAAPHRFTDGDATGAHVAPCTDDCAVEGYGVVAALAELKRPAVTVPTEADLWQLIATTARDIAHRTSSATRCDHAKNILVFAEAKAKEAA